MKDRKRVIVLVVGHLDQVESKTAYLKTLTKDGIKYGDVNGKIINIKYMLIENKWVLCFVLDYLNEYAYVPVDELKYGHYEIVDTI